MEAGIAGEDVRTCGKWICVVLKEAEGKREYYTNLLKEIKNNILTLDGVSHSL